MIGQARMGIKRDIFWRIAIAYFMVVVFGVAILFKVFKTQQIEGNYWRNLSDSLTTKVMPIDADRGNIYSADGRLLATSLPVFEIRMDLKADGITEERWNKNIDSLSLALANLFGDKTKNDYKRDLTNARKNGNRYYLIQKEISYPNYLLLKKFPLFNLGQNGGGLIAIQNSKRQYPFQNLAVRTIGYTRANNIQPVGLEGNFNAQLSGQTGTTLMRKYTGNVWLPVDEKQNIVEPQNGKDIITTLDVNMQDVAENALEKTLIKNKADHGCVIVMEVKTGAIKAIANLGKMKDGTYVENFNYAAGEALQPGSTFKLASMIALFEDGYVKPTDMVDVEHGQKNYGGAIMRDAEEDANSLVTIKKAFAVSSNVGISKLVYENYMKQPEKYLQHLRDLKLDQQIDMEIPGVAKPFIKNTKDKHWSGLSLPWMGVGYELQIAPLQTITLYNAVANGGKMMKPYLVTDVQAYGKSIQHFEPTVLVENICSPQTLTYVKDLLEDVVLEGTASNIKSNEYKIAGKTGTAVESTPGVSPKIYQPSFVGYFPADNPQYTIICVVYNPTGGTYYGSAVAAPVFKEISDKIYATSLQLHSANSNAKTMLASLEQLKPGNKDDITNVLAGINLKTTIPTDADWLCVVPTMNYSVLAEKTKLLETFVPDVNGMGLKDALYLLESAGLEVKIIGNGIVTSQSILPNTKITKGTPITIQLSTKP